MMATIIILVRIGGNLEDMIPAALSLDCMTWVDYDLNCCQRIKECYGLRLAQYHKEINWPG